MRSASVFVLRFGSQVPVGCPAKLLSERVSELLVFDPHPVEEGKNLFVDLGLGHPNARMVFVVVPSASVVDVLLVASGLLVFLRLSFAGDRTAAVAAMDEFTGIPHLMRAVDELAE